MTEPAAFAIIDPAAGAAGDMFLGALVECGYSAERLLSLPSRLGLGAEVEVSIERVERASVAATKVVVSVDGEVELPGEIEDGHHHHGPHRHIGEIITRIESGDIEPEVKEQATAVFWLLAEAEARVHEMAPKDVSLHEVGAWDALIDIVGTVEGFNALGLTAIYNRPPSLGTGWVSAAHGQMAVPTPATSILLEGLEVSNGGPVAGEAITPTGAALLRGLSAGSPPESWTMTAQGWGAGTRNPEGYANVLRLFVARRVEEANNVSLVTADVDDMSPEYLESLRAALFEAGALDVQLFSTMGKKGRASLRIEAQCAPTVVDAVTRAYFLESTTAGVRITQATRVVLPRSTIDVEVAGAVVRVKVLEAPSGPRFKAEYDDVIAAAAGCETPALELASQAQEIAREQFRAARKEEQQ